MKIGILRFVSCVVLVFSLNFLLDASQDMVPSIIGIEKDQKNREAIIHVSDPVDNSHREEIPCKYYSVFEFNTPIAITDGVIPESISGFKHEHYYMPTRPGGNCVFKTQAKFIIPRTFRENILTSGDVLGFLRTRTQMSRISPLVHEPEERLANGDFDSSLVPDNAALYRIFNSYSLDHPWDRLDDTVLVLCIMMTRKIDARMCPVGLSPDCAGLRINGSIFGIFEMKRNEYQNLCTLRERRGLGSDATPVIVFEEDELSFKIHEASSLRLYGRDVDSRGVDSYPLTDHTG